MTCVCYVIDDSLCVSMSPCISMRFGNIRSCALIIIFIVITSGKRQCGWLLSSQTYNWQTTRMMLVWSFAKKEGWIPTEWLKVNPNRMTGEGRSESSLDDWRSGGESSQRDWKIWGELSMNDWRDGVCMAAPSMTGEIGGENCLNYWRGGGESPWYDPRR